MTTLEINLSGRLAKEAQEEGLLLSTRVISQLIKDEIRRRAARKLIAGAKRATAASSRPISMSELVAEVNAVRTHKKVSTRKSS